MQKVNRRKKSFKLKFFENAIGETFNDIFQVKELLNKGEEITAVGYVKIKENEILVRTSKINEIFIFKNFAKVLTNNMEYIVNISKIIA